MTDTTLQQEAILKDRNSGPEFPNSRELKSTAKVTMEMTDNNGAPYLSKDRNSGSELSNSRKLPLLKKQTMEMTEKCTVTDEESKTTSYSSKDRNSRNSTLPAEKLTMEMKEKCKIFDEESGASYYESPKSVSKKRSLHCHSQISKIRDEDSRLGQDDDVVENPIEKKRRFKNHASSNPNLTSSPLGKIARNKI